MTRGAATGAMTAGRGRGMSKLPVWMTRCGGPVAADDKAPSGAGAAAAVATTAAGAGAVAVGSAAAAAAPATRAHPSNWEQMSRDQRKN